MFTCASAKAIFDTSAESTIKFVDEMGVARVAGFPLFFPFFPCPPCVVAAVALLVLVLVLVAAGGGERGLRHANPLAQLTVA